MSVIQKQNPACASTQTGLLTKSITKDHMADQILHKDKLREKFAAMAMTHGELEALELVARCFGLDAELVAEVVMEVAA